MRRLIPLALLALSAPASAQGIGECGFDSAALRFAGTPVEQAACLLRKVGPLGVLKDQPLPPLLAAVLTESAGPAEDVTVAAIAALPEPYRAYAVEHRRDPVSQTEARLPALYFMIHDTSTPFYGEAPFPKDIDRDWTVNAFGPFMDKTFGEAPVAHIFLNRVGQIWAGHDFSEGWRATKLESRVIGVPTRGRFLHIETVQPRRYMKGFSDLAHTEGPSPGFSPDQYRMLAALYVYASARAGHWLIPAFHATIDAGLPDAHDDPQNFDLNAFARELAALVNPPRKQP